MGVISVWAQWKWLLGIVGEASGCGHWEPSVGGGYTFCLVMKYPCFSYLCAFWQPHPYFLLNFCNLFYFCFFGNFFEKFFKSHMEENNIRVLPTFSYVRRSPVRRYFTSVQREEARFFQRQF